MTGAGVAASRGAPVTAFVVLSVLRWLPLALVLPVEVLLLEARGYGPGAIGVLVAAIGVTTAALELPTGGVADVVGRRAVLVVAAAAQVASLLVLALASQFAVLLAGVMVFAASKALASGPLEAWFVDAVAGCAASADRDAIVTRGLGLAGAAVAMALAVGSIAGGGLTALGSALGLAPEGTAPVIAYSLPVLVGAALGVVGIVALVVVVREAPAEAPGAEPMARPLRRALRDVPDTVRSSVALVGRDPVLRPMALRWLLVPAGFLAFELLTPVRLGELVATPGAAATSMGVIAAVCFAAQGAGAAAAARLAALGRLRVAAAGTVAAGCAFALAGQGGVGVLAVAVVGAHLVGGPLDALLGPVVHARVGSRQRSTVLSAASLAGQLSVAVLAPTSGVLAARAGPGAAFALAGGLTALGALPLRQVARAVAQGRPEPGPSVPAAATPT